MRDIEVEFEETLTLIVGENDAGKSSLIDCIGLFTGDYKLDLEDFTHDENTIQLTLYIPDFEITKTYEKDNFPNSRSEARPSQDLVERTKSWLETLSDPPTREQEEEIKENARLFGYKPRSNNRITTTLGNLKDIISQDEIIIENYTLPPINKIQLDGKKFENVESFFEEVFLREKQNAIWDTIVNEGKTIKEVIEEELARYTETIAADLESKGIKEKMKQYLRQLTDIKIEPTFQPRSLNITSKVKFLEGGQEITVDKKGDGTKRRITLALLEYKIESEEDCANSKLYVLDEPDTHLHVKAQIELLKVLKELSNKGCQVILTTHSPFLINDAKPRQIRLLHQTDTNTTSLRFLKDQPEESDNILRQLGIENVYLYFARKILLIEGETEEKFFPRIYENLNGISLASDLIKIINIRGVKNIPGFSTALLELANKDEIYILKDTDSSGEADEVIDKIDISSDKQFVIGTREFEDAFSDETIYNTWKNYVESRRRRISGTQWTIENITRARQECVDNPKLKFSSKLKALNSGTNKKFTKILLGELLGNHCDETNTPEVVMTLLRLLKEER